MHMYCWNNWNHFLPHGKIRWYHFSLSKPKDQSNAMQTMGGAHSALSSAVAKYFSKSDEEVSRDHVPPNVWPCLCNLTHPFCNT